MTEQKTKPSAKRSFSYLLRLWNEAPAGPGVAAGWRASLQSSADGVRIGFGSLDELYAYLCRETLRAEDQHPDGSWPDPRESNRPV